MQTEQLMQRASDIAYTSSTITVIGGAWAWMGQNATAIGALCLMIGALVGVATFLINWRYKHKYFELERRK